MRGASASREGQQMQRIQGHSTSFNARARYPSRKLEKHQSRNYNLFPSLIMRSTPAALLTWLFFALLLPTTPFPIIPSIKPNSRLIHYRLFAGKGFGKAPKQPVPTSSPVTESSSMISSADQLSTSQSSVNNEMEGLSDSER